MSSSIISAKLLPRRKGKEEIIDIGIKMVLLSRIELPTSPFIPATAFAAALLGVWGLDYTLTVSR